MENTAVVCLALLCAVLVVLVFRLSHRIDQLRAQVSRLERDLADAAQKIAEYEAQATHGDTLQRAVELVAGMGAAGLVLVAVVATTGFYGAAGITTALAILGGPFGMLGGIGTLIALSWISKPLGKYGYYKMAPMVIAELRAKGVNNENIMKTLSLIPSKLLPEGIEEKVISSIDLIE